MSAAAQMELARVALREHRFEEAQRHASDARQLDNRVEGFFSIDWATQILKVYAAKHDQQEVNHYEVLRLSDGSSATTEQIRGQHRKCLLAIHPDKVKDIPHDIANDAFAKVTASFNVLNDPVARTQYDNSRRARDATESMSQIHPAPLEMQAEIERAFAEGRQNTLPDAHVKAYLLAMELSIMGTTAALIERAMVFWLRRRRMPPKQPTVFERDFDAAARQMAATVPVSKNPAKAPTAASEGWTDYSALASVRPKKVAGKKEPAARAIEPSSPPRRKPAKPASPPRPATPPPRPSTPPQATTPIPSSPPRSVPMVTVECVVREGELCVECPQCARWLVVPLPLNVWAKCTYHVSCSECLRAFTADYMPSTCAKLLRSNSGTLLVTTPTGADAPGFSPAAPTRGVPIPVPIAMAGESDGTSTGPLVPDVATGESAMPPEAMADADEQVPATAVAAERFEPEAVPQPVDDVTPMEVTSTTDVIEEQAVSVAREEPRLQTAADEMVANTVEEGPEKAASFRAVSVTPTEPEPAEPVASSRKRKRDQLNESDKSAESIVPETTASAGKAEADVAKQEEGVKPVHGETPDATPVDDSLQTKPTSRAPSQPPADEMACTWEVQPSTLDDTSRASPVVYSLPEAARIVPTKAKKKPGRPRKVVTLVEQAPVPPAPPRPTPSQVKKVLAPIPKAPTVEEQEVEEAIDSSFSGDSETDEPSAKRARYELTGFFGPRSAYEKVLQAHVCDSKALRRTAARTAATAPIRKLATPPPEPPLLSDGEDENEDVYWAKRVDVVIQSLTVLPPNLDIPNEGPAAQFTAVEMNLERLLGDAKGVLESEPAASVQLTTEPTECTPMEVTTETPIMS